MTSSQQRQLSKLIESHKSTHVKFANGLLTQLAADFAAKGLLNLMTSSPVATGFAH